VKTRTNSAKTFRVRGIKVPSCETNTGVSSARVTLLPDINNKSGQSDKWNDWVSTSVFTAGFYFHALFPWQEPSAEGAFSPLSVLLLSQHVESFIRREYLYICFFYVSVSIPMEASQQTSIRNAVQRCSWILLNGSKGLKWMWFNFGPGRAVNRILMCECKERLALPSFSCCTRALFYSDFWWVEIKRTRKTKSICTWTRDEWKKERK